MSILLIRFHIFAAKWG